MIIGTLICVMCGLYVGNSNADPTLNPLVQEENIEYLGAFVPLGANYGGRALAYKPDTDSLFIGCNWTRKDELTEVTTPAPVISSVYADLPVADTLQPCADITDGQLDTVSAEYNDEHIVGSYLYNGNIYTSARSYYDNACNTPLTHGMTPGTDLSIVDDFVGFTTIDVSIPRAFAGYMGDVPLEWQSILGGPSLTGMAGGPIVDCSSSGPSVAIFDPATVDGVTSPFPATELIWYDLAVNDPYVDLNFHWKSRPKYRGVGVIPDTRSLVFVGSQGETQCYGTGTADQALVDSNPDLYCYDPCMSHHGAHGWPYHTYVVAYDITELLPILDGTLSPQDARFYGKWAVPELEDENQCSTVEGATFDAGSGVFYITPLYTNAPIVHEVKITAPATPLPPEPTLYQCVSDCLVQFPEIIN